MCELITLHCLTHDKLSWWDAVFVWSNIVRNIVRGLCPGSVVRNIAAMDFEEDTIAFIDRTWFSESQCNARTMLLVSITDGVRVDMWAEDWLDCRRVLGIRDRLNIR